MGGCPGTTLAFEVCQAFLVAVSGWQSPISLSCRNLDNPVLVYWRPLGRPKPEGVQNKWWKDFTLQVEDWLDGDQTGENLLRGLGPIDLARMLTKIKMDNS